VSIDIAGLLFVVGIVAGCVSAIAGGSGLITFPVLLSIGLPPTVANATNFVPVLSANTAALPAYAQELKQLRAPAIRLMATGLVGGSIGSVLLLLSSDTFFLDLVPWLLLTATLLYATGDQLHRWSSKAISKQTTNISLLGYSMTFLVSIYGGYFGAGLGVVLLAVLSLIGYQVFHEANALKNLINAMIGIIGVCIYAAAGLISWPHALVMVGGSMLGGYLGIRVARFLPQRWLTNGIIALGAVLSTYYFLK